MTDEIGTARIGLSVDSAPAEEGFVRIERKVAQTGRSIRTFGRDSASALDGIGAGGNAAASQVDTATRRLETSIERATAALNAGKKSGADYFEELARLRGVDLGNLAPALTGLREAEAAQQRLAQAADATAAAQARAAQAARDEALAQREAAQAAAGREQFLGGLREQIALYGRSSEEVLRYRAAQMGLRDAAEPLIQQLRAQREAQDQVASSARTAAEAQRQAAQVQSSRDSFVADLQRQAEAIGRTRAELLELRAAQLGVSDQAAPFIRQLRESEQAIGGAGQSAAATAAALRGVPAQITDIVVSLQGGQAPLTVLLQQGGQLRDMFGSTEDAARALGGQLSKLLTPYTIIAAIVAAMGVAYYQATEEADAYNRALITTGNAAGTTTGQMADMAREISKSVGTQAEAAAAIAALASTGQVGAENLKQFGEVAVSSQKMLGIAVADTAKAFAALGEDPLAASKRLDEEYGYLTLSVRRQIQTLQELGRFEEAAALAQSTYADAMDMRNARIKASMGGLESAWKSSVGGMKSAWDAFVGLFRDDTLSEQIEKAEKRLAKARAARLTFIGGGADGAAELAGAEAGLQNLKDMEERTKRIAAAEAERNRAKEAGNRWDEEGVKYLSRQEQLQREIARARAMGAATATTGTDPAETEKLVGERIAAIRKQYADVYNKDIDAQIEAVKRRAGVEEIVAKRSLDQLAANQAAKRISEEQYIQASEALDVAAFNRQKARLQEELRLTAGKPDSAKEQAALRAQVAEAEASIVSRRMQAVRELDALETQRNRTAATNYAELMERLTGESAALRGQITAQEDQNAAYGKTAEQVAALASARLLEKAARADENALIAEGLDLSGRMSEVYRQQAEDLRKLAGAQLDGAEKQRAAAGLQELNAYLDPTKAKDFGDALRDAFGGAGSAIVKMTTALDTFGRKQAEIDQKRGAAALALLNGQNEKDYLEEVAGLNRKATDERLRGYGDMTAAAAGFFGEQSRGYKVLTTMSQVFHAAELAATLAELVPKGISAVLTQGTGDPYSAFARMAAMAAIVAGLGVAIGGIGGSGGGGGKSAADMQKEQGSGSVFGDAKAQSDSIAASLEALEQNSDSLIPINKGMLDALRAIEASMTGLTNLVVRVPGLVDGENLGIATGKIAGTGGVADKLIGAQAGSMIGGALAGPLGMWVGGALGSLASKLWGSTKQTIVDSGLQFGGNVRDLVQGIGFEQYASVDTTKKSFFGLSKKTSNRIETAGLNEELSAQFGLVFQNVEDALEAAAIGLGVGSDHVTSVLDTLRIDTTKVSLKGLRGQALTDAISTVISKATDDMAQAVFPELDSFRKVGEGYAETVIRLASDYGQLDVALQSIGKQFGAVGLQSLGAREHLIEMAGGIDKLVEQTSSFAENFLTEAERLAPVQKYVAEQLAAMGLASVSTKDQFKQLVQGLDVSTEAGAKQYAALMGLADAFAAVADGAEEAAKVRGSLDGQIYDLTHTAAEATARARQQELAAMDASLRPLQERIYALQDEQAAASAAAEAAKARAGLEGQIYDLTHTAAEATLRQRQLELAAMDESLRPLQERVYALQDEKTAADAAKAASAAAASAAAARIQEAHSALEAAYGRESSALQSVIDRSVAAAGALRAYGESLLGGDLSPLSTEARLASLRSQFEGATPDNLQSASNAYLQGVKENGDSLAYAKAFAAVQIAIDNTADSLEGQAISAADQLAALNASVAGILQVNDSVLSVRDALLAYQALGGKGMSGSAASSAASIAATVIATGLQVNKGVYWDSRYGFYVDGSHANGLDNVPFDGYRAELHRGEKVLTSAKADDYRGGTKAVQQNNALLQQLITAVEKGNRSNQVVADTLQRVTRNGNSLVTEPA